MRIVQEAALLIAKINELWNGLVRIFLFFLLPHFIPHLNYFFFFFFFYRKINFILIWNYVSHSRYRAPTYSSITAIYPFCFSFEGERSEKRREDRDQANTIMRLNFFPRFLFLHFFYCFCLGKQEPKKWLHLVTEYIGTER